MYCDINSFSSRWRISPQLAVLNAFFTSKVISTFHIALLLTAFFTSCSACTVNRTCLKSYCRSDSPSFSFRSFASLALISTSYTLLKVFSKHRGLYDPGRPGTLFGLGIRTILAVLHSVWGTFVLPSPLKTPRIYPSSRHPAILTASAGILCGPVAFPAFMRPSASISSSAINGSAGILDSGRVLVLSACGKSPSRIAFLISLST